MWQSLEILNVSNTLTLKQIFWKMKMFFKKLQYCFLAEYTKIENATFPWFDVPTTQISIFILFVSGGVLFEGAFSLWVSLSFFKLQNSSHDKWMNSVTHNTCIIQNVNNFSLWFKGTLMQIWNLPKSSSSHENNMLKISH